MNIEEWLRADASRDTANPLEEHLGGLVQRVRRRRRRRAGAQVAGVVTAVAAGLVVWQVGGPWDRPTPPPATDPPVPAPTALSTCPENTPAVEEDGWLMVAAEVAPGTYQPGDPGIPGTDGLSADLTVSVPAGGDVTGSVAGEMTAYITDEDGAVIGSWEPETVADAAQDFAVAAGEGQSFADGAWSPLTAGCDGGTEPLPDGQYQLQWLVQGDVDAPEHPGSWVTMTSPVPLTVSDGTVTVAEESGDEASNEDESSDPGAEITAPESYEPTCEQAWAPPDADTGWQVSADFGTGPFQASPDGASGGLSTDVTLANTSAEELTADTYTQVVLVQDDTVVSPELLGSDDVRETTLTPGEETTQTAGHHLWDYCDTSWVGTGPSVPAGEYTAYVLLLDAGPYWDSGERAVLAVSEGQTIEVTE